LISLSYFNCAEESESLRLLDGTILFTGVKMRMQKRFLVYTASALLLLLSFQVSAGIEEIRLNELMPSSLNGIIALMDDGGEWDDVANRVGYDANSRTVFRAARSPTGSFFKAWSGNYPYACTVGNLILLLRAINAHELVRVVIAAGEKSLPFSPQRASSSFQPEQGTWEGQSIDSLTVDDLKLLKTQLNDGNRWDSVAQRVGYDRNERMAFADQGKRTPSNQFFDDWRENTPRSFTLGVLVAHCRALGYNTIAEFIINKTSVQVSLPAPVLSQQARPNNFEVISMRGDQEFLTCPTAKLGAQSALFVLEGIEACNRENALTADRCGLNVVLQAIDIQPQAQLFYMALAEKWDLSSIDAYIPVYNQMTCMFQSLATLKSLSAASLLFRFLESEKRQVTFHQFLTDAIDVMTKEKIMTDTVLPLAKSVLNGLGSSSSGKAAFNRNKNIREIFTSLSCEDIVSDKGTSLITTIVDTEEFNPSGSADDQKDAMEVIYNNFKGQCSGQKGIKLDLWYKKWLRLLGTKGVK
jgi:hypothetical protein